MPSSEAPKFSRREFFTNTGFITTAAILKNTEMNIFWQTMNGGIELTRAAANPAVRRLLFPATDESSPLLSTSTFYTPDAFEHTLLLAFGDSLADGFMDETDKKFAPGAYVADIVQTHFGKDWQYKSKALNGSTADYVQYIMEKSNLEDAIHTPTDIILSAGANNMRFAVERVWDKAEVVFQNPTNRVALEAFAQGITSGIDMYQIQMEKLLQRIQQYKKDGRKINRVFVEGIPDMANAQAIVLPGGKSIKLEGFILPRLASNISRLVNIAMLEAIKNANSEGFDVIFKDNARILPPSDITLMHPNIEGYKAMGDLQLQKSITQFPDGIYSFGEKIPA